MDMDNTIGALRSLVLNGDVGSGDSDTSKSKVASCAGTCTTLSAVTTNDKESRSCFHCGKTGTSMKRCTSCSLAWYCDVACQKLHRKDHRHECDQIASMANEPPPSAEDCPVCLQVLPIDKSLVTYKFCCGKLVCCGCVLENEHLAIVDYLKEHYLKEHEEGEFSSEDMFRAFEARTSCPFCREPAKFRGEEKEMLNQLKKRAEGGDPVAIKELGLRYYQGTFGLDCDLGKAMELFQRASDLDNAAAFGFLAHMYEFDTNELGIACNPEKVLKCLELGTKAGDIGSRHVLGLKEYERGNRAVAIRHWQICAAVGYKNSTNELIKCYQEGLVSKRELEESLRAKHDAWKEMQSEERDRWVVYTKTKGDYVTRMLTAFGNCFWGPARNSVSSEI